MKKIIALFTLLLSFFSFAQSFQGDALFTESHRQQLGDRLIAYYQNGTTPVETGWLDDLTLMATGAETFHYDLAVTGEDRAAWRKWYASGSTVNYCGEPTNYNVNGNNKLDPNAVGYNNNNTGFPDSDSAIHNVHWAGMVGKAMLGRTETIQFRSTSRIAGDVGQELINYVYKEIYATASNDRFDPSQGGALRTAGEPTRPNATYGTGAGRFPRNPNPFYAECSPWFQYMGGMFRYIQTFSLIGNHITDPHYTSVYQTGFTYADYIAEWFEDHAEFSYNWTDTMISNALGPNYYSEVYALPGNYGNPVGGSETYGVNPSQSHTHFNYAGTPTGYEVSVMQVQVLHNRQMEHVGYIDAFGTIFNNSFYRDYGYYMYKFYIKYVTFPDGTVAEHYRAYDYQDEPGYPLYGGSVGFNYVFTNLTSLFFMAHTHAVAVTNGFDGVGSDVGKYWDYTATSGTTDFGPSYTAQHTDGPGRNAELIINNLSKYFIYTTDGGFVGVNSTDPLARWAEHSTPMDPAAYPQVFPAILGYAYFQSTAIYDFVNLRSSAGYAYGNSYSATGAAGTGGFNDWQMGLGFGNIRGVYWIKGFTNIFDGVAPTLPELPITNNSKAFYEGFFNEY